MATFCPKVFSSIAERATQWMDVDLVSSPDSFEESLVACDDHPGKLSTGYIYKYTWAICS